MNKRNLEERKHRKGQKTRRRRSKAANMVKDERKRGKWMIGEKQMGNEKDGRR